MLINKEDIKAWLDKYDIKQYTINDDMTVDVKGNVVLPLEKGLNSIDVQFNIVEGSFCCSSMNLKSLKGSPKVVKEDFHCSSNELESLKYGPQIIGRGFYCFFNKLKSLEHCVKILNGDFDCGNNELTSLKYCPQVIDGYIVCIDNPIKNLNEFHCKFRDNFTHSGMPIELLKEYYKENEKGYVMLQLSYNELHKALLYHQLNNNLDNKLEQKTKKIKI